MGNADRRRLIAVVGAGAVVVVTTLIIVFVAIVPIPDFAPLQAGQQSGFVAYVADDDEEMRIVDLETTAVVTADVGRNVEVVGWHTDGNLVVADWRFGAHYVLIDPRTGDQVGTLDSDRSESLFEGRFLFFAGRNDGRVVIEHAEIDGSASFRAPASYHVRDAVPLGEDRIAFIDNLGRVAVTYLGEDAEPVLVAFGAREWSGVAARS